MCGCLCKIMLLLSSSVLNIIKNINFRSLNFLSFILVLLESLIEIIPSFDALMNFLLMAILLCSFELELDYEPSFSHCQECLLFFCSSYYIQYRNCLGTLLFDQCFEYYVLVRYLHFIFDYVFRKKFTLNFCFLFQLGHCLSLIMRKMHFFNSV